MLRHVWAILNTGESSLVAVNCCFHRVRFRVCTQASVGSTPAPDQPTIQTRNTDKTSQVQPHSVASRQLLLRSSFYRECLEAWTRRGAVFLERFCASAGTASRPHVPHCGVVVRCLRRRHERTYSNSRVSHLCAVMLPVALLGVALLFCWYRWLFRLILPHSF